MHSNRFRTIIVTLLSIIVFQSCTRSPFDPDKPATFNRDRFTFTQLLPAVTLRAISVAGNTAGVLGVAAMDEGGEIIILTNELGQWEELGRIAASTSSSKPVLDIAPDSGSFWFVLVSDDVNGVVLHHTNGTTDTEQSIPWFGDSSWDDECGMIQATDAGEISAVLAVNTRGPVLCIRTGDTWDYCEIPGTTESAQILSYLTDSAGQHHILYQTSLTAYSEYTRFSSGGWMKSIEVRMRSQGSYAGAPLKLSVPENTDLRAIGFDFSRDLLVMWELNGEDIWDSEALPIGEGVLIRDHLSVATAPVGVPYVVVARFNGMSRYDLRWYSYLASTWEVSTVSRGLHHVGLFNPIQMAVVVVAGNVPHIVFAELDSGGERAVLWDAVQR